MNKQLLKQYVENGGNCVNLGRFLNAKDYATYQWVLDQTPWLNNVKFNERVYCILNDITSQKLNAFGKPATFKNIFCGYITKEYTLNRQLKKQQRLAAQQAKPKYVTPTKLELVSRRTQRRNPELYLPTAVKDIDYVECPISGIRMHMITSKHIINNLNMTVEQFNQKFPDIVKTSQTHINAIKRGIQTVDPTTGLTKHRIGVIKAQETLNQVDENGISGQQKKGQKTRATHMSKIDEFGRTGYQKQVHGRLTTILPNGLTVEQNAHLKQKDTLIQRGKTGTGGASKQSKKALAPILNYLNESNIKYYFDKTEYGIKDPITKVYYFWDLVISDYKIAIEYQSMAWHADPTMSNDQWNTWKPPRGKLKTANEVLAYDYQKAKSLFENRKIVTFFVWEKSQTQDIENILCLLKTQNTKF